MRSSIACVRCRRSKVKCVNTGVNTTCRSCEASGRECTYPVPVAGARKREDSLTGSGMRPEDITDGEPKRQRPRKSNSGGATSLARPADQIAASKNNPFDPTLLTPVVWQELFDIFQGHFSIDLPFIHPPTFSKPLRQASTESSQAVRPPASEEFLLAFLALTARFHPKLVAAFSPAYASRTSNPLIASEVYASLARTRVLNALVEPSSATDIEYVQTLVMLAFYEWSSCRGNQAWTYLGLALRTSQSMGLHLDQDLDVEPAATAVPESDSAHLGTEALRPDTDPDGFVKEEIRRRTVWSCFLLERYMSDGKYRSPTLIGKDLRIQVPSSEHAFLFGNSVHTNLFHQGQMSSSTKRSIQEYHNNELDKARLRNLSAEAYSTNGLRKADLDEERERETLNSLYVEVVEVFHQTASDLCRFGPLSAVSNKALDYFTKDLPRTIPRQYMLNAQNTSAHINLRTSSAYSLIHFAASSAHILLDRNNLPFCPLRLDRRGDLYDYRHMEAPHSWRPSHERLPQAWFTALANCTDASTKINELAQACQEWNVLVETPIVALALYLSSFIQIYKVYYPFLTASQQSPSTADVEKSLDLLSQITPCLPLALQLLNTLLKTQKYFASTVSNYFSAHQPGIGASYDTIRASLSDPVNVRARDLLSAYIQRFTPIASASPPSYPTDRRESVIASDLGSPVSNGTSSHQRGPSIDANAASMLPAPANPASDRREGNWAAINTAATSPTQFRSYGYSDSSTGRQWGITNGNPQPAGPVSSMQPPPAVEKDYLKTLPTTMITADDLAAFMSGTLFTTHAKRYTETREKGIGWLPLLSD